MMNTLSKEQLGTLGEKFMEWGNLVFVGLVIGQLVPGRNQIEPQYILLGTAGVLTAYFVGTWLIGLKAKGGD